jgi:hypothetical protein
MSLVLRLQKGSALTNEELDNNFTYLDEQVAELDVSVASITETTIPELELSLSEDIDAKQDANDKLTSLASVTTSGMIAISGDSIIPREILAGSADIIVTNGTGVVGNPTISIGTAVVKTTATQTLTNKTIHGGQNTITNVSLTDSVVGTLPLSKGGTNATSADTARINLDALKRPTGTGIVIRTDVDSTAARTLVASGVGLTITNPSGVEGNITIATSATSANTPSTPVARDASGNFSAGTITANIVGNVAGNASTVTNGVVTSGSYSNPSWLTSLAGSKVTSIPNSSLANSTITINGSSIALGESYSFDQGTSSNASSRVVTRDSSGNFSAGTITASLSGNATSATSAQTSTTAQRLHTARTINGVSFDGSQNITIADSTKLPLVGGSLSGPLLLSGSPTQDLHAATKEYVDNVAGSGIGAGIIKAWVVFNGRNGAIVRSHNVNSVTRTSAGKYTINIKPNVFADGNFCVSGMASDTDHVITWNSASATTLSVYTSDTHYDSNERTSDSNRVHVMMIDL